MTRTSLILLSLLAVALLAGCPQPAPREPQSEQSRLLDTMQKDARTVQDPAEKKRLLDNIASLRKQMDTSHGTLEGQQRELDQLRLERERYALARKLKAASVEIPYFSPLATPQGLDLWVIPRDAQGDVLKVPGSLKVTVRHRGALGLGASGKNLLVWNLTPAQLQDKWAGQLYQGYHLLLPWPKKDLPDIRDAVVHVTFTNPDGKSCTAEKPIEFRE
jgi:hypothetical protein